MSRAPLVHAPRPSRSARAACRGRLVPLSPWLAAGAAALLSLACGDVERPDPHDEQEVITTVTLTATPVEGGAPVIASFSDPDGDGGDPPSVDPITLAVGVAYRTTVAFFNELASPPQDLTEEIADEAAEHQIFFTGDAVRGPATGDAPGAIVLHAYDDQDDSGLPVGLENTLEALATGAGPLIVTLRHLPAQDGVAVKTAALAEQIASDGIESLPGDTDAAVRFDITVH